MGVLVLVACWKRGKGGRKEGWRGRKHRVMSWKLRLVRLQVNGQQSLLPERAGMTIIMTNS